MIDDIRSVVFVTKCGFGTKLTNCSRPCQGNRLPFATRCVRDTEPRDMLTRASDALDELPPHIPTPTDHFIFRSSLSAKKKRQRHDEELGLLSRTYCACVTTDHRQSLIDARSPAPTDSSEINTETSDPRQKQVAARINSLLTQSPETRRRGETQERERKRNRRKKKKQERKRPSRVSCLDP